MIRSLVLATALFASPAALADLSIPPPLAATTASTAVATSSAEAATSSTPSSTPSSGMRPGVAAPPRSKHPYFFAAYAAVWAGIFAYALWLGARISSLEQKVTSVTDRSR